MADPLAWIVAEAEERARLDLTRRLDPRDVSAPGRVREGDRVLINFSSNDYLGLANDPRVVEAARRAATDEGWGAGASPLVSGWRRSHQALADDLADFERAEAALLFPSGFAANLGAVAALVGSGDAVYLDRLAHACLVAGAKVAGASVRVFPHNDLERLESILRRDAGRFRRSLIATEGVFSMDGDLAPLAGLVELAERFGAMLLVDEAHGTGVFGPDGRGAASECGVAEQVHVRVGTLSKALGSIGGFVVGSRALIDHILHRAPSFVYSTATPPAAAAAAREALTIARVEPWRRERVRAFGRLVAQGLVALGFDVPGVGGPIVPWIVGDSTRALSISRSLRDRGLLVPAIRPPTVPRGTARLRISHSAAHTEDDVRALLDAAADLTAGCRAAEGDPLPPSPPGRGGKSADIDVFLPSPLVGEGRGGGDGGAGRKTLQASWVDSGVASRRRSTRVPSGRRMTPRQRPERCQRCARRRSPRRSPSASSSRPPASGRRDSITSRQIIQNMNT